MKKQEYFELCRIKRQKYLNEYKKLKDDYLEVLKNYEHEKMRSIMKRHNNLIIETINDVLNEYKEFDEIEHMFLLTGSLARDSNLLYSDVDINIMYDDKYRKEYLQVEEKISYMLTLILGFRGRDRIHGITYYLPIIDDSMMSEIINNKYALKFDDGVYEYSVRENSYDTMFNTFNSTRSIGNLKKYLIDNQTKFVDWANVYKSLGESNTFKEFHNDIKKAEKANISKCNFEDEKKLYIIFSNKSNDVIKEKEKINELKIKFKEEPLHNLYSFMSYLYKLAILYGFDIENVNFNEFQDSHILYKLGIDESLYDYIYNYFSLIAMLQYVLNELGFDLSKHNSSEIDVNNIDKKSLEIFENRNLMEALNTSKNKMNNEISKILVRR